MENNFIDTKVPFVLFKLPSIDKIYLLRQKNKKLFTTNFIEEEGFYAAPFDFHKHPVLFIPLAYSEMEIVAKEKLPRPEKIRILKEEILYENHEEKVARAIEEIKTNKDLSKLVISNRLDIKIAGSKPLFHLFTNLINTYKNSFVYYWHHPGTDFDMAGASPEKLLDFEQLNNSNTFTGSTVSLAGTRIKNINWTEKEYEEQKLVTDYIKNTLFDLKLAVSQDGPYDYTQGHLIHLKTDLRFMYSSDMRVDKILKALHPTPAVAGLPKKEAQEIIPGIEHYDRKYYTGFFGFKLKNKGLFHVNLRNMEISNNQISLYAGGGITLKSNPAAEWKEIQRKWEIMKAVL